MIDIKAIKIGDRIKLLSNIYEAACGEHPTLLYAKRDEEVIVRLIREDKNWIGVSHEDILDNYFYICPDEAELT